MTDAETAAKNRAAIADFNEDLDESSMKDALDAKRKELAKFKKNIENKDKHVAKVKRLQEEAEANKLKKEEENAEKVRIAILMRQGKDPDDQVDDAAAYEAFSVLDVDASGRISLRELQRYLAGDAEYFHDIVFQDADVGIKFEAYGPGLVKVLEIESYSPASKHPDLAVGLKLLTFNGDKPTIDHLPKFKEWDAPKKNVETLRWLEHLVKVASKDTPYTYKFLEPKYIFNPFNNKIDIEVEKSGIVTVEIPEGAYNSHDEIIMVVQNGIKKACGKLGKAKVLLDRGQLIFTIESGGPDFRFLWATGPSKNEKAGPTLGFGNVDTEWDDEHKGTPMTLDLNMMLTADQVTIFTMELAKEFDESFNNYIEYNEFVAMYEKYLKDDKSKKKLVDAVVARFLSAEKKLERKIFLEEDKKRKKRAKDQLKARAKQKALAKAQANKRKANMKRDDDGVFRQHHQNDVDPDFVPPLPPKPKTPPPKTASEVERDAAEEKMRAVQREKKAKQMEKSKAKADAIEMQVKEQAKQAQATRDWQERQNKLQLSMLGLESLVEDSVTQEYHPACTGFIMKKKNEEDCEKINPMYFGYQNMKTSGGKTGAGLKQGGNYTKYKKMKHGKIVAQEKQFVKETPAPPLATGKVRAKYKDWGERYDNQEIVNPAFFGQMTVSNKEFDPNLSHPAFHGYMLFKKPVVANDAPKKLAAVKEERKECIICYVGKAGCPLCWDFPEEFSFLDYAYEGPKRAVEVVEPDSDDEEKPEIHTNLTTSNALKLYRGVNQHWVTVYVKTVPCGQIVKMQVEKEWTIQDLYENFRSASMYGSTRDCFLFLPTEQGVYSMENELEPETDTTNAVETALVPMRRYNFTTNLSIIVLLHFQFFSEMTTCINIAGYLNQNLNLPFRPETKIIPFVDSIPKDLPGKDQVQKQLIDLMKLTIQQDTRIRQEDLDADNAEIGSKIKFKVDELKEKLLIERKAKAEILQVEREERRDRERAEQNAEHETMYKEVKKKEKKLAEEARKKEEEAISMKNLLGKGRGMVGSLKKFGTGLPGIKFGKSSFGSGKTSPELDGEGGVAGGRASPTLEGGLKSLGTSMKNLGVTMPPLNFGRKSPETTK